MSCPHATTLQPVTARTKGCEECLKIGSSWVHLRLCLTCGHVGCCDSSPNRHATQTFHAHDPSGDGLFRARRAVGLVLRRSDGFGGPDACHAVLR